MGPLIFHYLYFAFKNICAHNESVLKRGEEGVAVSWIHSLRLLFAAAQFGPVRLQVSKRKKTTTLHLIHHPSVDSQTFLRDLTP